MATYAQLIADLEYEAERLPDNIAFLIREVEQELWQQLYFCAPEQTYSVTVTAGSQTASLPTTYKDFMQIKSVLDPYGKSLRRTSKSQFNRLRLQDSVPELYIFSWEPFEPQISVWKTPAQDSQLLLIVYEKESPIQDGDDETTKFFLGEGYNVLKYAVLYKRIFHPDKWEMWRARYSEAFLNLVAAKSRQRLSLAGGSPIAPRYADQ